LPKKKREKGEERGWGRKRKDVIHLLICEHVTMPLHFAYGISLSEFKGLKTLGGVEVKVLVR
jgi:hypothetical protein